MTMEPKTCTAVIPDKPIPEEQNTSCSALFYLFQEVSKLASSDHDRFPDSTSSSKWFAEASRKDPVACDDVEAVNSSQTSTEVMQTSSVQGFSGSQEKEVQTDGSRVHVLNPCRQQGEGNSPWKALSLINLQCRRLLHQSDPEDCDASLASSSDAAVRRAVCDPQAAIPDHFDHIYEDCADDSCRSLGFVNVGSYRVEEANAQCSLMFQSNNNVDASLKQQDRLQMDINASVSSQVEWSQRCTLSMSSPLFPSAQSDTQLTSNSNYGACVTPLKPVLAVDDNANLVFSLEHPPITQLPCFKSTFTAAPSPLDVFNSNDNSHSVAKWNAEVAAHEPESVLDSTTLSPSAALLDLSISVSSASSTGRVCSTQLKEGPALLPTPLWKTKTPRKQPHPCRSADSQDPDFQGVTFRMDTELDDTRKQCRLLITSKYSKELCRPPRKQRLRRRTSQKCLKSSSSEEEESELMLSVLKVKVCASCCTRKTPMWRDAEDGTPLCNACGIRYKKYRVRCANCWHIPRKEGNSNSYCLRCGKCVRLTSAQKKHTS